MKACMIKMPELNNIQIIQQMQVQYQLNELQLHWLPID